ncbi:MAG: DUF3142 domain-containing protein [Blastocatellia bacterium]
MRTLWATRTIPVGVGVIVITLFLTNVLFSGKPRVLAVDEVPVAFWAWRIQTPSDDEISSAFSKTGAKILFLHAGQIDISDGIVRRIRPVSGRIPTTAEIHFVYNGTRKFLTNFEQTDIVVLAETISKTYQADRQRAEIDQASVKGIQLDLDIPTRLLPRYAEFVRRLRTLLPSDTTLSITGLPTWAESDNIRDLLAQVDFWIPQCYGLAVPTSVDKRIPISSASEVARTIAKVRLLNKPFYAGLSAYSYAIHYDQHGNLLELRGDIDPALAAQNTDLELIESGTFGRDARDSQIRYVYNATSDLVLDGLIIVAGESLVFDLPSAASLRASARAVRENAGERLLGVCIFRLPTLNDETTLGIGAIAAALLDTQTDVSTTVSLTSNSDGQLTIHAENTGTASSALGKDALTLDLNVPAGSVKGVIGIAGFSSLETLCSTGGRSQRCSGARANIIRVTSSAWEPGTTASITLSYKGTLSETLAGEITTQVNDGRVVREQHELAIRKK